MLACTRIFCSKLRISKKTEEILKVVKGREDHKKKKEVRLTSEFIIATTDIMEHFQNIEGKEIRMTFYPYII
jgi:hypothetical protein